jgi:hydrogenase nickel incorporation protein HypA/HybF
MMHELAICESLLGVIEEQAKTQHFCRVCRVRLEIGPFSGVETEALRFGFDVVTKGSIADGAELEIIIPEGRAWCHDCNTTVTLTDRLAGCPLCGGASLQITGGKELRIKDLEVE